MLILSVGMPRAGSGWYYQLKHDLICANGGQDAHEIRRRYHLERILTEINCNIGALTPWRLIPVLIPSLVGNTYVVKAHSAPTPLARLCMQMGWIKATYIYRDPRDAMLSAYENGQRALQNGRSNAFSHLISYEDSLRFMESYVQIGKKWLSLSDVLHARYEDLVLQYEVEVQRLLQFLQIPITPRVEEVIKKYQPQEAQRSSQAGLHFRKGKIGRFRQVYSLEQQEDCSKKFAPFLEQWGYKI